MGFEPVTLANWAMKPHIGSEVNLLSSYLPEQWNDVKYIWNPYLYCGCRYNIFHIISLHGKIWSHQIDLAPNVWLHSSVGRASRRYHGGHGFESHWSPDIFQASSFQLLKLENLLRWSLFTFIYNCSTNMDIIYISHCLHIVINSKRTMFKNCKKTAIRWLCKRSWKVV